MQTTLFTTYFRSQIDSHYEDHSGFYRFMVPKYNDIDIFISPDRWSLVWQHLLKESLSTVAFILICSRDRFTMSILGLVNPGSFLKKVQRETAQDQSAPLLKPKSDKLILLWYVKYIVYIFYVPYCIYSSASTIPILTLMLTIFFEPNVFVMNDLEIYNPESMYSYLTDVPYIKSYCWTHLQHVDESGRTISLIHYRLFPYILLFLAILILPAKMTWKFVTTENLINGMTE